MLGRFVPAFGRIVAMMQFNMYHHYTVDEHLLRCIGMLSEIEARPQRRHAVRQRADAHDPAAAPRRCSTSRCSCTTSPRAGSRTIRSPARGVARSFCPRLGFSPAETETVAWLIEKHLVMSTRRAVARPLRPHDHREFRRGGAVGRADEAAHHPHHRRHPGGRPGRVERLEGAAHPHALLRDRAGADRRLLRGQSRAARRRWRRPSSAPSSRIGRRRSSTPISRGTIRPIGSRSTCRTRSRMRASCARPQQAGQVARHHGRASTAARGVTELTVLAPDHPWLLSIIAGACAVAGANIVDAQIFTTTDGRALDTIAVSREFERDEDEARRAARDRRVDREGAARRHAAARGGGQARGRRRAASRPSRSSPR